METKILFNDQDSHEILVSFLQKHPPKKVRFYLFNFLMDFQKLTVVNGVPSYMENLFEYTRRFLNVLDNIKDYDRLVKTEHLTEWEQKIFLSFFRNYPPKKFKKYLEKGLLDFLKWYYNGPLRCTPDYSTKLFSCIDYLSLVLLYVDDAKTEAVTY